MTQPTAGFGQTVPSPRRAKASAARIALRSTRGGGSIAIRRDPPDEFPEILGLAEVAVYRRKADISHLIEGRQRLHHEAADHVARNIGFARTLQLPHQRIDDPLDAFGLDGALTQRDVDRAGELVPIEGLALAMFFYDRQ